MASGTLVSVEEYLRASYQPNCEYIDGVLRPKALGTRRHGELQMLLGILLKPQGYAVAAESLRAGDIVIQMSELYEGNR